MNRTQNMILSAVNFVTFCLIAWANSGFLGLPFLFWGSVFFAGVCVVLFVCAIRQRRAEG